MQTNSVRVLHICGAYDFVNVIHPNLGGYEPSTPYQPSKKRKTSSRSTAGPSTAKAQTTRQRKPLSEVPVVIEDDEEDVSEVVASEPKSKRRSKATAAPATNGKAPTRAKGKGRAASTTNGHKSGEDLVIIDDLDDDEPPVAKPPSPTKKGKTRAGPPFLVEEGEIVEESASSPELEKMREERDLVRPLPAPQYKHGETSGHCCTVQSQERGTIRKYA
jgi:hypothetical protein